MAPLEENYDEILLGWVKGSSCWYRIIQLGPSGSPVCPCTGFKYRRKCSHIDRYNKGDYSVDMQFSITFSREHEIVTVLNGEKILNGDDLTIEEAAEKILRTEAFLEKLTGLRVHIEQVL